MVLCGGVNESINTTTRWHMCESYTQSVGVNFHLECEWTISGTFHNFIPTFSSPTQRHCDVTSFIWCWGSTSAFFQNRPDGRVWHFKRHRRVPFQRQTGASHSQTLLYFLNATYNNNVDADEQRLEQPTWLRLALHPPHLSISIPVRIWELWKPDASGSLFLLGVMGSRGSSAGAAPGLRINAKGVKWEKMKQCTISAYSWLCSIVCLWKKGKKGEGSEWKPVSLQDQQHFGLKSCCDN